MRTMNCKTACLVSPILGSLIATVVIAMATTSATATMTKTTDSFVLAPAPFESWAANEMTTSFAKMRSNIFPQGMLPGMVVASPSTSDPNYFFYWVRDAALVTDVVFRSGSTAYAASDRSQMMENYLNLTLYLQRSNPMHGLGEAKFNPDGSAYTQWNSPQNDGPALRAITLIHYAHELMAQGRIDEVRNKLYDGRVPTSTAIKTDLEFVSHHWSDPCFDLWEEVFGTHFYTRIVQASALRLGAQLANDLGDGGAANFYDQQARSIMADLPNFWDDNVGYLRVTRDVQGDNRGKSSGLDTAIILGVLHANLSQDGTQGAVDFGVLDSRVMATAEKLEEVFGTLYSINDPHRFADVGTAIGRYPEDRYSGRNGVDYGNPWVLNTAALAEYAYRVANEAKVQVITVDSRNLNFINRLTGNGPLGGKPVQVGLVIKPGSAQMADFTARLHALGDLYLKRVQLHANADGSLSEQIDRYDGFMGSARDLSWSYASYITAYWAR